MSIRKCIALLPVEDLDATVAFYRDALGFALHSSHEESGEMEWCRLKSGTAEVMFYNPLAVGDAPAELLDRGRVILYMVTDDLARQRERLSEAGHEVSPIRATFYGLDEFDVTDPAGYTITFGQRSA
ncbi:MAG TPA: VOC family protein [Candidatus Hydrogenedentes bacterium]|nr:VOC family protein [Candidatus Hydrogenedentota bacterium]HNT86465.1 VOC family protein [Candidatus Hydrogenedentota bacterium]